MSPTAIENASNPEKLFLANLALIERLIAIVVRRHALSAADADDFGAWTKERLIDGNYAILRKFAGRSSFATYLTTVLANLFRDFRNDRWGRWRPSAEAKRRGAIAIRLEEMMYRDGSPLREAVQILRSVGVPLTESELVKLAHALPQRAAPTAVSLDTVDESQFPSPTEPTTSEDENLTRAVEETVRSVVSELPVEDSLILRMRFWSDMSVADIARALRVDQKPLYRRLDSIQARLRTGLEARGIDRERATEVLSGGFTP